MQKMQTARDRERHVLPFVVPVEDVGALLGVVPKRFPQVPTLFGKYNCSANG